MAAKKAGGTGRQWVQVPTAADVELLRARIAARGPLWDQWAYKLHRDRIVIYDPVIPGAGDDVDPARRPMRMHLRVSPRAGGPFELEWRRHTERWFPLYVTGTVEQIADAIAGGKVPMTRPTDQHEQDRRAGR